MFLAYRVSRLITTKGRSYSKEYFYFIIHGV
jgi:hypothetical protein